MIVYGDVYAVEQWLVSSRFTHLRTVKNQLEFIVATSSQRLVSVAFYTV